MLPGGVTEVLGIAVAANAKTYNLTPSRVRWGCPHQDTLAASLPVCSAPAHQH